MKPCTAYANSRPVGDFEDTITIYRYDVRNVVRHAPPAAVANRGETILSDAPPSDFVDVLHEIVDGTVTFTGRPLQPVSTRSGVRTFTGIRRNVKTGNYRVTFVCDCGRKGYTPLHVWRNAHSAAGCYECRKSQRNAAMKQIPQATWRQRAEREAQALMRNPMGPAEPSTGVRTAHVFIGGRLPKAATP